MPRGASPSATARDTNTATSYEKLKSLPEAARWLNPGVTFGFDPTS